MRNDLDVEDSDADDIDAAYDSSPSADQCLQLSSFSDLQSLLEDDD
jgi:hypothetical protein